MSGAPRDRLRRALLLGGAAAGVVALWNGGPALLRLLPQRFDFAEIAGAPGFRRLEGSAVSGGAIDPFAGIGATPAGGARAERPSVDPETLRADLCGALFGGAPPAGVVPIASFSDYNCAYCRVLTRRLVALAAEPDSGVAVTWHEWALLGPTSRIAAQAALAAERQGAYLGFHEALMRGGFVPTPAFLDALARRIGIDPAQMRADMESPGVARRLAETDALAGLFGFIGTPSLVVGRTALSGAVDDARLRALIARERADGPIAACG